MVRGHTNDDACHEHSRRYYECCCPQTVVAPEISAVSSAAYFDRTTRIRVGTLPTLATRTTDTRFGAACRYGASGLIATLGIWCARLAVAIVASYALVVAAYLAALALVVEVASQGLNGHQENGNENRQTKWHSAESQKISCPKSVTVVSDRNGLQGSLIDWPRCWFGVRKAVASFKCEFVSPSRTGNGGSSQRCCRAKGDGLARKATRSSHLELVTLKLKSWRDWPRWQFPRIANRETEVKVVGSSPNDSYTPRARHDGSCSVAVVTDDAQKRNILRPKFHALLKAFSDNSPILVGFICLSTEL